MISFLYTRGNEFLTSRLIDFTLKKKSGLYSAIVIDEDWQVAVDSYETHKDNVTNYDFFAWASDKTQLDPYKEVTPEHFYVPHPTVALRNLTCIFNLNNPDQDVQNALKKASQP